MKKLLFTLLITFTVLQLSVGQTGSFVHVKDGHFYKGTERYRFLGANYWYGMYLGVAADGGDRARLKRELDQLKSMGVNNLRVMGSSEGTGKYQITPALLTSGGQYNEMLFQGLDFLLSELASRDMTAVLVLNNFWMWSGGMPQYVSEVDGTAIPYPFKEDRGSWDEFINYSLQFFENKKAQNRYLQHIRTILNRKNTVTGITYKDDPVILSWQLANEPRGYHKKGVYRKWIKKTAKFINRNDKNHMISLGTEGDTGSKRAGVDLYADNRISAIDYATVHLWIQNWGWYDPQKPETFEKSIKKAADYIKSQLKSAAKLNKPVVIEEFGVSRDNGNYQPDATVAFRDQFYEFIFKTAYENMTDNGPVQGCNFWAWGGEGRPFEPGERWKGVYQGWRNTDDLIGDPPHEGQGWYSVYDKDETTIKMVTEYAQMINALSQ